VIGARTLVSLLLPAALLSAAEAGVSQPVDCLPDRVAVWQAAEPTPEIRFGAAFLPGIVLGPPGESVAFQGSASVASLGFGGSATLAFDDIVIEDRPGPDFIVFENAFFQFPVPTSAADNYFVFAEPGIVEVSADGATWVGFPFDQAALLDVADQQLNGTIDRDLKERLVGLAGITPTMTGNWTVADDPAQFDPAGQGGVSGAGGDAFDLADVGLTEARYVRITDADSRVGFAGTVEGFDLETVVVLHGRPASTSLTDADGDGLSDDAELALYLSDPLLADSDGDGIDDGREVAGCRDPASAATAPVAPAEVRLWVLGTACTELRFSFAGTGRVYDLIRGELGALFDTGAAVDLGATLCLADDHLNLRWSCDGETPQPGSPFFYLVRVEGEPHYGRSSSFLSRGGPTECP